MRRKFGEVAKRTELRAERLAEMFAVRGVECAVAETVITVRKRDDVIFLRCEHGGFKRGFHGFKTGVTENNFAGYGL